MQILRDLHQLPVARQGQHRPVKGPVGLRVRRRAAGGRRAYRRLRERTQLGPSLTGHRAGEPQHHRDLDQSPHLGQLGQLPRTPLDDPEAAVRHDLDGALQSELLHGFAHRRRRDPEAFAEDRRRVDLARLQLARHQRRPQRVEDLPAHRGALHDGSWPWNRLLGVRVLAPRARHGGVPLPVHVPRTLLRGHPGGALCPGGAVHALLHGVLLRPVGTWVINGGLLLVRQAP